MELFVGKRHLVALNGFFEIFVIYLSQPHLFPRLLQNIKELCRKLHKQIDLVDEERYDMEIKTLKSDKEVNHNWLTGMTSSQLLIVYWTGAKISFLVDWWLEDNGRGTEQEV